MGVFMFVMFLLFLVIYPPISFIILVIGLAAKVFLSNGNKNNSNNGQ